MNENQKALWTKKGIIESENGKYTVGGYLDLRGTGITALPENLTVGGYLDLEGCTGITALPENLTVGGSLDLEGCTGITALPENLTVGGSLDLRGTGITALPENLTVGGSLDLEGCTGITRIDTKPLPMMLSWQNGRFILIDSILSEVISKHGLIMETLRVGKKYIEYIVTDGNGRYSHGSTIKEAKESLIYKLADRDTSKYKSMNLETVLTFSEAVQCYRAITGACEAGTRGFVQQNGQKETYTINEMIEVTKGQYGNKEFTEFFSN